jgi:hypothetical protein
MFLRGGEASKLFVTSRPFLLTVSGSHLGTAATVLGGKASKHLFCVSKVFLKLGTALSNP